MAGTSFPSGDDAAVCSRPQFCRPGSSSIGAVVRLQRRGCSLSLRNKNVSQSKRVVLNCLPWKEIEDFGVVERLQMAAARNLEGQGGASAEEAGNGLGWLQEKSRVLGL